MKSIINPMACTIIAAASSLFAVGGAKADTPVSVFTNVFNTAEVFTFLQLVTGNTYIWCGTDGDVFNDNWCTWESAEQDGAYPYGINQTGDYFRTADASNQKARLRIGSGSYTFPQVRFGANGGTSHVVMTGGVLRASTGDIHVGLKGGNSTLVLSNGTMSAAYWLTAGRDAATTSTIEVHGGTLTTAFRDGEEKTSNTGNGMMDLASYAGSTTYFKQTGGRVHAAGSANSGDKNVAMAVGNNADAQATVELTGGVMDLDGVLQVPRAGNGTFSVGGGTLDVLDFVQVGTGSNSTGMFAMSNGTANIRRYIAVGFGAGSTARVNVSGGTMNLNGQSDNIGFLIGDSASANLSEMNVSQNGVVNAYGDSYVGWNSAGKLTIEDDGYVCVGTPSVNKWFKINNYANVTNRSEINLNGGTLDVCHIRMIQPGDGYADVNFNGGKINVYANNSAAGGNVFGNVSSGDLRVYIKENGGTISVPSGVSVNVNEPLLAGVDGGVDGGFTKEGDGTLTLIAGENTYVGPTVVKGGTLSLASGGTLASTSLELAGGVFSGATFDTITISAGDYRFSSLPTNLTGTVTLTGGILRMTAAEAKATVDTATVVVNGGTLLVDGSLEPSLEIGATLVFSNVTLGVGIAAADAVKVAGAAFDWTYDAEDGHPRATAVKASGVNVWTGGAEGNWSDAGSWAYGVPAADGTAYINNDATILFESGKTVGAIVVNADVLFKKTAGDPEINVDVVDGTGTLGLYHVGFRGKGASSRIGSESSNEFTLEFVSTVTDGSDSWLVNMNVYAPMTGSGYVRLYGGTMLYGDNGAFTGDVKKDDADVRFMAPRAGFPNAKSITVDGTIWLWFDEGEIEFGGNFTAYATGNCGINLPGTVSDVVMTVGGGNGNVILSRGWNSKNKYWYNYYSAFVDSNGWQQGTDKFTLRKVGTGSISEFGFDGVYNLSLEGGSVNLGAEKVDTGADTILSVTNATLGIAADTVVASAYFGENSTLSTTFSETTEEEVTTYDAALLTVSGAASLDGVALSAAGTTPNTNTVYTVLSTTLLSGTATAAIDDPDDSDRKVWKARVGKTDLSLSYRIGRPGFILILQ